MMRAAILALLLPSTTALAAKPKVKDHNIEIRLDGHEFVFGGAVLGVSVSELNGDLRTHFGAPENAGVLIASVVDKSAAAAAGIQVGDVLTHLAGEPIDSHLSLKAAVQHNAGEPSSITVVRDGKSRNLTATIEQGDSTHLGSLGGKALVFDSDKGTMSLDIDELENLVELKELGRLGERFGEDFANQFKVFESGTMDDTALDELHIRIDDLEQQLLDMTDRLDAATSLIQEQLDQLNEK